MRFILTILLVALAFCVGVFVEHDFGLVNTARTHCSAPACKCKCPCCANCDCCSGCPGNSNYNDKCTCKQCDCCPKCVGQRE
jgi:hypothetical protein